ncbi:type VI secretion system domain-containing protein [Citrobacter freundii]|uniref:type VI secretion system domain-containing protein n=1 Tax=Citrobacter freundii TaxID=546 RepID=UPI00311B383A
MSDATRQWLADEPAKTAGSVMDEDELTQQVWQSYREQGLEAALALAEQQPQHNQRARFYSQYLTAQLLEASGMAQLAQQHYRMLFKTGLHTMLSDWEPSLLEQLEDKLTPEQ